MFKFDNFCDKTLPSSWNSFILFLLAQSTTLALTITQLKSTLSEEYQYLKRQNQLDDTAYATLLSHTKKKKGACSICKQCNHATQDCHWFRKDAPKCNICGKVGHEADKCWKNPVNKGKGHTNKDKKGKKNPVLSSSKGKGKACTNVAEEELSSNEELTKSFTTYVNVSDEGKMSKASEADFSTYLWIINSSATTHICANLKALATYHSAPRKIVKGLRNKPVIACRQGTVLLRTCIDNKQYTLCLTLRVLYMPEARQNLISVG